MGGSKTRLLVSDFVLSLMWVSSSVFIKIFVYSILGFGFNDMSGDIIKAIVSIINMFFFALLGKFAQGGAYNPLTILYTAISGDFTQFLFTVGARIPVQVLGSIVGVKLLLIALPGIGQGPILKVDIHQGALTEGLLTFAIVFISLRLTVKIPGSFFMKTWIASVSKLTLQILGSDLTGGVMNPASVMGWAYARGDYLTKEHILVYWLAPIEATLVAVWLSRLLTKESSKDDLSKKSN